MCWCKWIFRGYFPHYFCIHKVYELLITFYIKLTVYTLFSDCVDKKERAPAYGLALATFGLSFCIGPILGSYIASTLGSRFVFIGSFCLVIINIAYIILFLPETVKTVNSVEKPLQKFNIAIQYLPYAWSFTETFRVFSLDPFLSNLALIVFMYYISVWAVVSTLMVYVTSHLHFTHTLLGYLLTGYGLSTMFSEGILVRIIVPLIGEVNSMRLGLASCKSLSNLVKISFKCC